MFLACWPTELDLHFGNVCSLRVISISRWGGTAMAPGLLHLSVNAVHASNICMRASVLAVVVFLLTGSLMLRGMWLRYDILGISTDVHLSAFARVWAWQGMQ